MRDCSASRHRHGSSRTCLGSATTIMRMIARFLTGALLVWLDVAILAGGIVLVTLGAAMLTGWLLAVLFGAPWDQAFGVVALLALVGLTAGYWRKRA